MKNNIKYILKFLFKKENGKFRISYVFPIIASISGSYIIFMIFSIMNGMGNQIENRINSFHYKYYYQTDEIAGSNININKLNKGNSKIVYVNHYNLRKLLNLFEFRDFNKYIETKINEYLIIDNKNLSESDIIIGDDLALELNLNLGDSLEIYYPSDMNLSTHIVPSEFKSIIGIFNIDLLEHDKNTIIGSLNEYQKPLQNFNYYFDVSDNNDSNYNNNIILSNLIIKGLNLEKKIYYFFGFLVIIISCFMLFQINLQFIKEKMKQLSLIAVLGFKKNHISLILLLNNLIFISFMCICGIFFTNLTIFFNLEYNMFQFVYNALPFDVMYISILNIETLLILIIINFITIISSILPMLIIKNTNYVKF